MRRNSHPHLGVAYPKHLYTSGLGMRIVEAKDDASNDAEDLMVSAKDVYPFGQPDWEDLRFKWRNIVYDNEDAASQIIAAANADNANPANTDWDNTALGKWLLPTIEDAFRKKDWYPPSEGDKFLSQLANQMALYAYKIRSPYAYSVAAQTLGSKETTMPKEFLDILGITSNKAKDLAFWKANPNYVPSQKAVTPVDTTTKDRSPFGKIKGTNVNVRDNASTSANSLTKVNEPLPVQIYALTNGWYNVGLPNGNVGWVSADLITEISAAEYSNMMMKATPKAGQTTQTGGGLKVPDIKIPVVNTSNGSGTTNSGGTPDGSGTPDGTGLPDQNTDTTGKGEITPTTEKKDNTMLYLGIGAGVLALGGIAWYLSRGNRHSEESAED